MTIASPMMMRGNKLECLFAGFLLWEAWTKMTAFKHFYSYQKITLELLCILKSFWSILKKSIIGGNVNNSNVGLYRPLLQNNQGLLQEKTQNDSQLCIFTVTKN